MALAIKARNYFKYKIFWIYTDIGGRSRKNIWSWPISRVLSWTIIHLGSASPLTSSNLPKSSAGHTIGFLFGLAPNGVYHRHKLLPVARCALTAPFHPYLTDPEESKTGGILSAALSVGSRPPGVTWRSTLWSPDFPRQFSI